MGQASATADTSQDDPTTELLALAVGAASNIDAIEAKLADPRLPASAVEGLRNAQAILRQVRDRLVVAADVFDANR